MQLYLILTLVVGLMFVIEGIVLYRRQGKWSGSFAISLSSTIEGTWGIVSLIVLLRLEIERSLMAIPILYIIHATSGLLYGFGLFRHAETEEDAYSVPIPNAYLKYQIVAGFILCFICGIGLKSIVDSRGGI